MKIAIHHRNEGFSRHWIDYCREKGISYKIVDCYSDTIVEDLADCEALMWHFHHANCKDVLFSKELMYSLQTAGKVVFPDFHTAWHFDDKVGQRYLLEATGAPMVPSYIFYKKTEALHWVQNADFPKVFKLRRGSGSSQVRLVNNRSEAQGIVRRAFGKGFSQYDAGSNLKERWRKFQMGKTSLMDVMKGVIRFGYTTDFDRVAGNEIGYVYFQDYIPENYFDIRVIVIDDKAFAIKRMVRENDFRASGSGYIEYGKENFDDEIIRLSFTIAEKLQCQSVAMDFVYNGLKPLVVELSYGYINEVYEKCEGYWDRDMNWRSGPFNPQNWMVELVLKKMKSDQSINI